MNRTRDKALVQFQKDHKLAFKNSKLLEQAFIHSSISNESSEILYDNQRLEYLGDSVLGLIINKYLFTKHVQYNEGELSQLKSVFVSEEPLAKIARNLGLGELILFGKGEKHSGGKNKNSNLADCLEALIAAIFLDRGLDFCESFVLYIFKDLLDNYQNPNDVIDYKTCLQEKLQKNNTGLPEYKVVSSYGPDHKKIFEVAVFIQNKEMARGKGASIKKAQTAAAKIALQNLELQAN